MNWLVSSRKYVNSYESQKSHLWDKAAYKAGIHDQVGKKVGILGYGSIGRQSTFHPWSLDIHKLQIPQQRKHHVNHRQLLACRTHWV
jgi:phosphoglycerate dehydrogenase-like enzyme